MRACYPLPRLWLITDERQDDALWPALKRLPRGSGIIVRHYSLDGAARRKLFDRIRSIARKRSHILLLAGDPLLARQWGADGYYGTNRRLIERAMHAAPIHNIAEIRAAERKGATMLLLSPLFPTRSHPGAAHMGIARFAALTRATQLPVIALGGVTSRHWALLKKIGGYGWAGIDAFVSNGRIRT